ncbi:MAG: sigma-70 family RNA polymerase sigma factor [Candidatus Brocadiia bacterium]
MAQLARQFRYTPRARLLEQVERVRELAASVRPDQSYPYDFVCYHITRFRPDDAPSETFDGESLLADLMALLHEVSDSLELTVVGAGEPVLSLEEVRRTYDVSLKTVRRWRAKGLVALRFLWPDGRMRTGVLQSDLEAFVESHPEIIGRTGAYTFVDDATRRAILVRAFELSLTDELSLDQAVGRLAREFRCSHASVRSLLQDHERKHPDAPIFPRDHDPLTADERGQVMALYRDGAEPGELARTFLLGRATVRRVVREIVLNEILGRDWHYVACPAFEEPDAEQTILADLEPEGLREMGMAGPLDVEQEERLFRQYNFLKYLLAQAREELSPSDLDDRCVERVIRLHDAAIAVRNCLVVANLRLVVHLASRHVAPGRPLDGLVSDGTVSLMQAVRKFDFTRGVRFSTYASWAIRKNFAKTIPREYQARHAASTGTQELIDETADPGSPSPSQPPLRRVLHSAVASLLLELSPREREVVAARFGIGREAETLEQIGRRFQVSRERVRQIEARALRKLAEVVDPSLLEELG